MLIIFIELQVVIIYLYDNFIEQKFFCAFYETTQFERQRHLPDFGAARRFILRDVQSSCHLGCNVALV